MQDVRHQPQSIVEPLLEGALPHWSRRRNLLWATLFALALTLAVAVAVPASLVALVSSSAGAPLLEAAAAPLVRLVRWRTADRPPAGLLSA